MKITIKKDILEKVLKNFQPFLNRDFSQVTSHIYLEAKKSKLLLKAINHEIGIESAIYTTKEESEGSATINGKIMLDFISKLKNKEILLETNNNEIYIKQEKVKFILKMFNMSEFPQFPQPEKKINIDTLNFLNSLRTINPVIENNNNFQQQYNGALIDIKEKYINFVSTNTKRLAVVRHDMQSEKSLSIIIPKKAVNEILRIFNNCHHNLQIYNNETQLLITTMNEQEQATYNNQSESREIYYTCFTQLINGKFPNYEKIIPTTFKTKIRLPKDIVIESIKMISSAHNNIKITLSPNQILFEIIDDENYKAHTQIEIKIPIDYEISITIKSGYILDFLSQTQSQEFDLCLNDSNSPITMKDDNFSTIIMPIIF